MRWNELSKKIYSRINSLDDEVYMKFQKGQVTNCVTIAQLHQPAITQIFHNVHESTFARADIYPPDPGLKFPSLVLRY